MQTTISAPALAYLFAEWVAPAKGGVLDQGVPVPGSEAKVSAKPLAGALVAISLWSLHRQGAISLRQESKKGLLRSKSVLTVTPAGSGNGAGGDMESGLLHAVPADGASAAKVVGRWFGRDTANPWGDVIRRAMVEAVAAGAGEAKTGGLKNALGAIPEFVLGGPGREPFAGAADRLLADWEAFSATYPELHAALIKECQAGLTACESN
jgi:hypothetical protein